MRHRRAAERYPHRTPGLAWRDALLDQVLGGFVEIVAQFVVDVSVSRGATNQAAQATCHLTPHGHDSHDRATHLDCQDVTVKGHQWLLWTSSWLLRKSRCADLTLCSKGQRQRFGPFSRLSMT